MHRKRILLAILLAAFVASIVTMTPRGGATARSATYAAPVAAQSGFTITSPTAGSLVPCGQPITVTWTGGSPSDNVNLVLIDVQAFQVFQGFGVELNTGSRVVTIGPGSCGRTSQFYVEDSPRTTWTYGPVFTVADKDVPQFFTQPAPRPVASPRDAVVVNTSNVRITTAYMVLDGPNPHQQNWLVKANGSGSLNIRLQAGSDCCTDGISSYPSGGTITANVFNVADNTVLATFSVTPPPPVIVGGVTQTKSASDSRSITTTPGGLYRINLSTSTPPQGTLPPQYRLKFDGAEEAGFVGRPQSVFGGLSDLYEGTRWVMNVGAGESLAFSVLPGGPANLYGSPNVIKSTYVTVFDPNHVQRLPSTLIAEGGSAITVPDAGSTPGAWVVVVVQPIDDRDDPSKRPPYRILKGEFNFSTNSIVPATAGLDRGVYTAWFTDGKDASIAAIIHAPAAISSVNVTFSADVCTEYEGFPGPNCSFPLTVPTNQTILGDDEEGVGQAHATIIPPPGTIADPAHLDIPLISDALTTVTVYIRDVSPPALTLPANITAEATRQSSAVVTFTASAKDNVDGPVPVTCASLSGLVSGSTFPLGTTTVSCSASDSSGNTAQGSFTVTVKDSTPPVFTSVPTVDKAVLWPPDHKMIDVMVDYAAADNCSAPVCTLSVTSNEPVNGTGDGDMAPDWEIVDAHRVRLRAERAGTGSGRIYTITIICVDAAGNSSSRIVTVNVPKSQK